MAKKIKKPKAKSKAATTKERKDEEALELVASTEVAEDDALVEEITDEEIEIEADVVLDASEAIDNDRSDVEISDEVPLGLDHELSDIEAGDIEGDEDSAVEFELDNKNFIENTELASFESAEIEDIESIDEEQLAAILESLLFATDKPQSVAMLKSALQGTNIKSAQIRQALDRLKVEYANPVRGVSLEESAGGYQLRTKVEFQKYLARTVKARPFRLSGPALEVLSIVAYKQPCTKSQVDEIRGVESGHLMRGLLDRGLIHFGEKSELPGRPMFYETTRKFLEIFNLRNISELPSLNEIDQLIPEGIGEVVEEKETLSDLTGQLSTEVVATSYSEGEEELIDISSELQGINTSTEFFEQEKRRQKEKRDRERAQDIQERLAVGETVETRDQRWLARYEVELAAQNQPVAEEAGTVDESTTTEEPATIEAQLAAEHLDVAPSNIQEPIVESESLEFQNPTATRDPMIED